MPANPPGREASSNLSSSNQAGSFEFHFLHAPPTLLT
jgi:hypothetical protein